MRLVKIATLLCVLASASCVIQRGSITQYGPDEAPSEITSSMKAFLQDGSIAVYPDGALISDDSIRGVGTRYSLGLQDAYAITTLSLDSVIGIEAIHGEVDPALSVLATIAGTALTVVAVSALAVAIFGSCPTFYASAEQGGTLQSEAFSYSIAPLLEARDIDALHTRPDADGLIRLELRNEALETHYINHLELVAAEHAPGVRVVPDDRGRPIGLTGGAPPVVAVDAAGRSVRSELADRDGEPFTSADARIRETMSLDDREELELVFDHPGGDEAVLELRLRNSLLSTVLLYDVMLGSAGAEAVDWLGQDMTRISDVVELGRWFREAMGMTVEVHDGRRWRHAGRISDTGPIAWEDVGVQIDLADTDLVRVRLEFFTDAWRIDRVSLARPGALEDPLRIPVSTILASDGTPQPHLLDLLAQPDDDYLITHPGTSATLEFRPPLESDGASTSYLLSSQGYYTEWIRPTWIRNAEGNKHFRPDEKTVETLMSLWLTKKDAFEEAFYSSRIPVR